MHYGREILPHHPQVRCEYWKTYHEIMTNAAFVLDAGRIEELVARTFPELSLSGGSSQLRIAEAAAQPSVAALGNSLVAAASQISGGGNLNLSQTSAFFGNSLSAASSFPHLDLAADIVRPRTAVRAGTAG